MIVTVTCNPCVDKSFLVKGLRAEAKMKAWSVRYDPGGGGINVSRVIQRLGGETIAVGFAGGHTGAALPLDCGSRLPPTPSCTTWCAGWCMCRCSMPRAALI